MENTSTTNTPLFSIGDHIISNDGHHGIIHKISKNYYGWVYCFYLANSSCNSCVSESNARLYTWNEHNLNKF